MCEIIEFAWLCVCVCVYVCVRARARARVCVYERERAGERTFCLLSGKNFSTLALRSELSGQTKRH